MTASRPAASSSQNDARSGRPGEAAGHAHDRDAVFVARHGPGPRGDGRLVGPDGRAASRGRPEFRDQMLRHAGDVRVVEDDGVGGDVLAREGAIEPVAQLDRHQRVHAEVEETDRDRRRGGQPQHGAYLALEERCQHVLVLRRAGTAQPRHQVLRRARVVIGGVRGGQEILQEGGAILDRLLEDRPVHRHHDRRGGVLAHQPFQRADALLRREPAAAAGRALPLDPLPLLRRLADLRPRPPGDGLSRQAQRAPVARQLVEEGVGGGVVRLARVADHADAAGEEEEHVEVAVQRGAVEVPGAQDLGPQHRLEALPRLVRERCVGEHAHAVDHAAQRRQLRVDARQHRVDRGGVGHVGQLDLDPHAGAAQRRNRLDGFGVGIAAAVQDDGAGAVLRHPGGHGDADAAQPARHEVGAVGPEPPVDQRRRREHDLARGAAPIA